MEGPNDGIFEIKIQNIANDGTYQQEVVSYT